MYLGNLVRLRALEMDDLDDLLVHWNNLEMRQFLATAWPMSRTAERKWIERATTYNPFRDGEMVLAIEEKDSREFLGTVSFFGISKQHSRAEFGIAIHNPENFSRGYGTDATKVMLWVGFHILGLNSIFLVTLASNQRAQRAYEKAGFKRAGMFREGAFMKGEFHDFVIMDVLKSDFFENYPPGTYIAQA